MSCLTQANFNQLDQLTEPRPKPPGRRVKTYFQSIKAFSVVLCFSFKEEVLSSSDIPDAITVSTLTVQELSGIAIDCLNESFPWTLLTVSTPKTMPTAAHTPSEDAEWLAPPLVQTQMETLEPGKMVSSAILLIQLHILGKLSRFWFGKRNPVMDIHRRKQSS